MGKLHYVNRKNGGMKLGKIIAKDLLKRLSPGTTRKVALRDPSVDLDISAKELNDEAVTEIADALSKVVQSNRSSATVLKLEELCLSGNFITARSLPPLARVVRLASSDLRDFDLSDNQLSITTLDEARAWEDFLLAFRQSNVLRRLDFSGNALGVKAFEVLSKIYTREEMLERPTTSVELPKTTHRYLASTERMTVAADGSSRSPSQALRKLSISSNHSVKEEAATDHDSIQTYETKQRDGPGGSDTTCTNGVCDQLTDDFSLTRGLRSVPYLILDGTHLTDTCALHLSFIVADHDLPTDLLPYVPAAKAGPPAQRLAEYDQDLKCRGIMYQGRQAMGNDGWRVLELAERARDKTCKYHGATPDTPTFPASLPTARRRSDRDLLPIRTPKPRRASNILGSGSQESSPQSRVHDLGTLRSKLQGESIRDGLARNDLWSAAIKMLSIARGILVQPRPPAFTNGCWSGFYPEENYGIFDTTSKVAREFPPLAAIQKSEKTAAAPVKVNGTHPEAVVLRLKSGQNGQMLLSASPHSTPEETNGNGSPNMYTDSLAYFSKDYRSAMPGGFDEGVWANILARASGACELLSERQRRSVVAWARDRTTLHQEMGELGKPKANQIWRVLDGMDCLSYEPQ